MRTVVRIRYEKDGGTVTRENGEELAACKAQEMDIMEVFMPEGAALPDGTEAEIWDGGQHTIYKLADGTELLRVQATTGPSNVYGSSPESFDDLSEAAKVRVLDFYEAQGLFYDAQAELEKAYAEYLADNEQPPFAAHFVGKEIVPTASNEKMMYFMTIVTIPANGNLVHELRMGTAFDRNTGEHIENWELFSCPEEEVKQKILDIADVTNPVLRAEMLEAFRPEYIVLFAESMDIAFPHGSLPSETFSYALGLDYDEKLCEILHAWAPPGTAD